MGKYAIGFIGWIPFFLIGWGLSFTIYLILQVFAILNLRGIMRILVMLPIPIMTLVVIITIWGYQQQSNLWPIFLIFVSPVAIVFVGSVWAIAKRRKK